MAGRGGACEGGGAGNEVSGLDGPGHGCEGIWAAAVWKARASGWATPSSNPPSARPPWPLSRLLLLPTPPSLQPTLRPSQMVPIKPLPCGSSTLPTRLPSPSGHMAQLRVGEPLSHPVLDWHSLGSLCHVDPPPTVASLAPLTLQPPPLRILK